MRNCAFCFVGSVVGGKCERCGTMHEDDLMLEQELKLAGFDQLSRHAQDARRDAFEVEFSLRKKIVRLIRE